MEFELDSEKEVRKKKKGLHVSYEYRFKGLEESVKSVLVFRTEKRIDLEEEAVIDVPFVSKQTKIKGK